MGPCRDLEKDIAIFSNYAVAQNKVTGVPASKYTYPYKVHLRDIIKWRLAGLVLLSFIENAPHAILG